MQTSMLVTMALTSVRAADPRLSEAIDVVETTMRAVEPDRDGVRRLTKREQRKILRQLEEAILAALPDVIELPAGD